jgi:Zn-dependent protease/CBS domain-containing protein
MKSWSISIGRVFGVELRLHLTFLLLLAIVWVTESGPQGAAGAWRGLALVGIILLSVLFHEFGHLLVAKGAGVPARSIILLPIGGVTLMDESRMQNSGIAPGGSGVPVWKRDIRIAIAGPLVNLAIAFLVGGILLAVAPDVGLTTRPLLHSSHLLRSLFWANLYLAICNLLPAYPLDGGRVLRALFSRSMEMVRATRRAVTVGQSFAILFMLGGMLWNFLFGGAVWTLWLTLLGFFLFVGTQLEERSVVFQSVLEKVCMEDVMLTDFATLSPADTLEDALEKAVHSLQDDFPVVRGSDMVGVVSKQSILQALRAQGNGYVQAVMSRVFDVAQRRESLASAFRKITARGLTIIPVVEDQRLVGIVTLQNLMHSMALLAETRKLRREALNG